MSVLKLAKYFPQTANISVDSEKKYKDFQVEQRSTAESPILMALVVKKSQGNATFDYVECCFIFHLTF